MTRRVKKILMCSMAVPWPTKPTLCAFHHDQANALAEFGTEMRLFSPAPALPRLLRYLHPRCKGQIDRPRSYEMNGVQTESPRVPFAFPPSVRHRLAIKRPNVVSEIADLAMRRALRRTIKDFRPDALMVHGIMPMGRLVQRAAREHGLPFSIIEHSAGDVMRLEADTPIELHYRDAAKEAENVFVVGTWMDMHLRQLDWHNVIQLPNGTSYPEEVQLNRPRPEDLKGRTLVLSAAHYNRRKGFEELVEAFTRVSAKYPEAMLVVISNGCESLRNQIDVAGLGDKIRALPLMSQDALKQWMVWADVFAMPSWSEAFGLVYVEAMTCRNPVIMSGDCGLAPQLGLTVSDPSSDHHGWITEPRDVGSVTIALDDALSDRERLGRMGDSAHEYVGERFTWRENARQLLMALGEDETELGEQTVVMPGQEQDDEADDLLQQPVVLKEPSPATTKAGGHTT